MFQLSNVFENRLMAMTIFAFSATLAQNPALAACDVVRIEVSVGNTTYLGSAIPLTINGKSVLVTADHVLPFDVRSDATVQASLSGGKSVDAVVVRRDWASDLMILSPVSPIGALCNLSSKTLNAGDSVVLAGFPAESGTKSARAGSVIDPASSAIRVARPISLIKATGLGEKGMSGGAMIHRDGTIAGMLLQDWVNPNHSDQSGVYALPAAQLALQASAMLSQSELEMPAPFQVRRAVPEMSAYGFRFRPTYGDSIAERQLKGSKGGHPDGIGGESGTDQLEVVGLSGETIAPEWLPMAKILRRIQSEGGSEMLVKKTASDQSCGNLVELGRILIENPSSPPDLSFYLNRTSTFATSASNEDIDTLSERAVILALSLAETSSAATEPAQKIRALQADWIRTHQVRAIQELLKVAQAASPQWAEAAEIDSRNWKAVVELQVLILRMNKALGQATKSST